MRKYFKKFFIFLLALSVIYILIDSQLGQTEAKGDLLSGVFSYTEYLSSEDIVSGKVSSVNLYVNECGKFSGSVRTDAILKITNKTSGVSLSASYDSNVFSKSGNGSSDLSFSVKNVENKCGKKTINLTIKNGGKSVTKALSVTVMEASKSTKNWTFTLSPATGTSSNIVVKDGSTVLKNGYHYVSRVRNLGGSDAALGVDVIPMREYKGHTPGEQFVISYYKFSSPYVQFNVSANSSGTPIVKVTSLIGGVFNRSNWNLKQGSEYTVKSTKVDSKKMKVVVSPTGGSQYLSGYGSGNSYVGFYGSPYTVYMCYEGNSWGRYSWCNSGDTDKAKSNFSAGVEASTTKINAVRYALDGAFIQGDSVVCGDKLLVGTCTGSICQVYTINGNSVKKSTRVYKSKISENKSSCGSNVPVVDDAVTTKGNIDNGNSNNNTSVVDNGNAVANNSDVNTNVTCVSSAIVTNAIGEVTRDICYVFKDGNYIEKDILPSNAVSCASGYRLSYNLSSDDCHSNALLCKKTYQYNCVLTAKPRVFANGGKANSKGVGVISISAKDIGATGIKGYYISSGDVPTVDSNWSEFKNSEYTASVTKPIGTYYIWVISNDNRISYGVMSRIHE